MVKKTIILLVLYFFCSFTLLVYGEKKIFVPNLTNIQDPEPVFFGPLEPEPFFGPLEPEPLEKKSGAGAGVAKKYVGSPALLENTHKRLVIKNNQEGCLFRENQKTWRNLSNQNV